MIDLSTVVAIIGAMFAANAWLANKLDKIRTDIATLRTEAKDYVTHTTCHQRRAECPCIATLAEIEKRLKELDK